MCYLENIFSRLCSNVSCRMTTPEIYVFPQINTTTCIYILNILCVCMKWSRLYIQIVLLFILCYILVLLMCAHMSIQLWISKNKAMNRIHLYVVLDLFMHLNIVCISFLCICHISVNIFSWVKCRFIILNCFSLYHLLSFYF